MTATPNEILVILEMNLYWPNREYESHMAFDTATALSDPLNYKLAEIEARMDLHSIFGNCEYPDFKPMFN